MKCLSCGTAAQAGRFCSDCGAALEKSKCQGCGHQPPAGARFCNQCGSAMGGSPIRPGSSGNQVAWWMAGALLLGLIMVIAYPVYGPGGAAAPPLAAVGPAGGVAGGAAAVDLSSMTPREAADRLFNRVMTAVSANDNTEVVNFLPMAIRALELAFGHRRQVPLGAASFDRPVQCRGLGGCGGDPRGATEPPSRVGHGR